MIYLTHLPYLIRMALDLSRIYTPVLIVGIIAAVLGAIIVIIFKLFAVPKNQRFEDLMELLPGVNCGGCGYSGCAGYAEALAEASDEDCSKCTAGGKETAQNLSNYLGMGEASYVPKVARVACQGSFNHMARRYEYKGSDSCLSAHNLFSGPNYCIYGCLGYGDCKVVCEFGAIEVTNGLARINPDLCTACGKCTHACPKHLISLQPKYKYLHLVACTNPAAGGIVRKSCDIGCIGCRRCVKACPHEAINMTENRAVINQDLCVHCGACKDVCPTHAIISGLYEPLSKDLGETGS